MLSQVLLAVRKFCSVSVMADFFALRSDAISCQSNQGDNVNMDRSVFCGQLLGQSNK